ncbi:MAG: LLM class flavin-dependent oxidoreductase [Planctomycetaceae bacterium]
MRFSLSVPNFGPFADARLTATIAREAETAGWDGVFVWDHLLGWEGNVVADPWIVLTAVALRTRRVRIGPMVTPLARRRPWQVVREAVTLDHLSGGRVILGVGLGSPAEEDFARFGEPTDDRERAAILDEALEIVDALLRGEVVDHDGPRFHLRGVRLDPPPVQRPRIPIWVAGSWPHRAPFRRAARYEGVIPVAAGGELVPTVEEMREVIAEVRSHRTSTTAPYDHVFTGFLPDDPARAVDLLDELEALGVTWWQTSIGWPGEELEAFRDRIRRGPPGRR